MFQKSADVRRWFVRAGVCTLLVGSLLPVPAHAQDEKGDAPPPRLGPMPGGRGLLPPGGPPEPEPADVPSSATAGAQPTGAVNTKKVPCVQASTKVTMDYMDAPLMDVTKYMAEITCRNFILSDDLKGQITIISHQQVTVAEAYEGQDVEREVLRVLIEARGRDDLKLVVADVARDPAQRLLARVW